jgi:threonine aldolase
VIAAAGIVALETMVDRLAEDHVNARILAKGLSEVPGLSVALDTVESNMVYVDHSESGLATPEVLGQLKANKVLVSSRPPKHIRLVTNRHHDRATIEEALVRIRRAMR